MKNQRAERSSWGDENSGDARGIVPSLSRKCGLWLSIGILLFGAWTDSLCGAPPPSALTALRAKMKSVKTLEAQFTQEVQDSLFPGDEEKAEGALLFEKPDYLVWTYKKPDSRVIRYEKRKLVIEEKGHREVVEAQGSVTLEAAFSFLWGETHSDLFVVEVKSNTVVGADTFILKPRRPSEAQFRQIEFRIEKSVVAEARVTSLTDAVSVLRFSEWKLK